jgi:protein-L-isoaspartate(D-aspartate) O-methyltransferase
MAEKQARQSDWLRQRKAMVDQQIRPRGVNDHRVLAAMMNIPREMFVPAAQRHSAYEDRALAVGHGQTISQPYIVAYMTEQLAVTPGSRILEIGTGTGYQTAILACLCREVFSVERIHALQKRAVQTLSGFNLTNVHLTVGDGSVGLPAHAPYDRILVTAASPRVPSALVDQLVDGGRIVLPVGSEYEQTIVCVDRRGSRTIETPRLACRFVKLIGEQGW